jgi:hypothetical protein
VRHYTVFHVYLLPLDAHLSTKGSTMQRKPRRLRLQLEALEGRALLSGPGPALNLRVGEIARSTLGGSASAAMTHDLRHGNARLAALTPQEKSAQAEPAVGKRHVGPFHSASAAEKATADLKTSLLFKEGAKFGFRAFNSTTTQTARILPDTPQQFSGFNLTVTPQSLPAEGGFRPEVLDLNFQYASPLLRNGEFKFGPIGMPENVPVLQSVKITHLYMYFTTNGQAVSGINTFGIFQKGHDPLDKNQQVFFLNGGLPSPAVRSFFVLRGRGDGEKLVTADFRKLNVPTTANGIHIDVVVTPV